MALGTAPRAREVCALIDRASALGIRVNIQQDAQQVEVAVTESHSGFAWDVPGLATLPRSLAEFALPLLYRASGSQVDDLALPFVVPVPYVFQAEVLGRYAAIPTLGHLLAAATADRRYILAVESMHESVPLLLLALLQVPGTLLPFVAYPPLPGTIELSELSLRAAAWLARALPSAILSGHPAEMALHQLVVRLLPRDGDQGPTPLLLHDVEEMPHQSTDNWISLSNVH